MALPENDFIGRLGAVIEQRGLPSEEKKALISEADRQPAGKRPSAAEVVQKTTDIMKGLEPMISEESLSRVGLSKGENASKARKLLEDAAQGIVTVPKQYEEANTYLSALGKDLRGRKELAEKSYEERIQEALRILREEEKEEPMTWGEVAGRVALATAPALIGAIMGPGVGAGAAKGIMYGLEEADKRKEKKKDRLRQITELGVKSDLEKEGAKIKGLAELEQEVEKSKAKLPISYAEAAATLQQLGARGLQGRSKAEQDLFSELVKAIAIKAMEGDRDGKEKAPKEPTQSQFKAARFAMDLEQAESNLISLFEKGYDPGALTTGVKEFFTPEKLQGEEKRLYDQATTQFANAVLRPETGAVIGVDEKQDVIRRFFPVTGDSEAVKVQKRLAREQIIASTRAEAGTAYDQIRKIQSPPAEPTRKLQRVKQNGKEYLYDPVTKQSTLVK